MEEIKPHDEMEIEIDSNEKKWERERERKGLSERRGVFLGIF